MKRIALMALASGLAIAAATPANAAIFIAYSTDGGVTKNLITTGSGSSVVSYSDTVRQFDISGTVAGSPFVASPNLFTNSLDVRSNGSATQGGAGTIILYITETNVSSFSGSYVNAFTSNLLTGSAQTAGLSVLVDAGNGLYTGTQVSGTTFNGLGATSFTTPVNFTGPFSQTAMYTLTFGRGDGTFNDTINITGTAVPEPATWGMMIMGFGLLGGVMRRRSTKVAFA